jgi:hypothetical protein
MVPCDILLVTPPTIAKLRQSADQRAASRDGYIPPLGLGYLAARLEQAGFAWICSICRLKVYVVQI